MGVKLIDENGWGWEIKQVLYAHDTVLVEEIKEPLQHIANEFDRAHVSTGLKIDAGRRKVLVFKKDQRGSCEKVRVIGNEMQGMGKFNYLKQ